MTRIMTTVRNGRIEIDAPKELTEGTDVLVEVIPVTGMKIGISEAEWRDDPEALADWDAWIKTLPVSKNAEDIVREDEFDETFRKFNLDAVRKQMNETRLE
jgi:hypothetical protein